MYSENTVRFRAVISSERSGVSVTLTFCKILNGVTSQTNCKSPLEFGVFEKYLNISVIQVYVNDFYRCQNHNKTTGKPVQCIDNRSRSSGNWQKKISKKSVKK